MQTTATLAAETVSIASHCDPINRMVQFLTEGGRSALGTWNVPTKDPNDYERRRRLWQDREQRARRARTPE